LSRVIPALWTKASRLPPQRSRAKARSRSGAAVSVMSSGSEVAPIRFVTAARSSPAAGMSMQTTAAP
jgi:hypothetical protein